MNVYVIASEGGMCKIGIAVDPANRLTQLKTGHPHKLTIAHAFPVNPVKGYAIERAAHAALADKRLTGEWFDVTPEIAAQAVNESIMRIDPPKVDDDDRLRDLNESDIALLHGASVALADAQMQIFRMVAERLYSPNQLAGLMEAISAIAEHIGSHNDDDDL